MTHFNGGSEDGPFPPLSTSSLRAKWHFREFRPFFVWVIFVPVQKCARAQMTPNSCLTECGQRASEDGLHLSVQKRSHVWTGRTTTSSARLRARTWGGIRRIVKGRNRISGSCQNSTVLVRNLLIRCRSDLWSTVLSYKKWTIEHISEHF